MTVSFAAVTVPKPVPQISAHSLLLFLLQVSLLLGLALALGWAARRLRMPAVAGELCAGILVGPSVLQQVAPGLSDWLLPRTADQFHLLDGAGELGVLLMVGITGATIDVGLIRRERASLVRISGFSLVIPLGLGVATGFILPHALTSGGDRTVSALFLGTAMCVSAIPVIVKIVTDLDVLHRDVVQMIMAVGTLDDVFGWFLLSVVSAMAAAGVKAGTVTLSLGWMALVVVAAAVVGRPLVAWALAWANRSPEPGPTVGLTAVLILAAAAGTQALGLEAIIGAFVCGILVSRYGRPEPRRLAPLRLVVLWVLAPIFFATAGLRMNLTLLAHPETFGVALLVLAVAVAGKFAGAYVGARTSRKTRWEALAIGAGVNARGIIGIIVASVGLQLGVVTTATYTIIVLVAVITSLMAPPVLRRALTEIEQTAAEHERHGAYRRLAMQPDLDEA